MLASIVIKIKALENGTLPNSNGMAINASWYTNWGQVSSEMGDALHEKGNSIKPFTMSPLMDITMCNDGVCHYEKGQESWFRITTLQAELTNQLQTWLNVLQEKDFIELAHDRWQVTKICCSSDDHPWAGRISYEALSQITDFKPLPSRWTLTFLTPMTLHGNNFYFPFPQPESLVRSWLSRWNAFAPEKFSAELPNLAREYLAIESYALQTVPVHFRNQVFPGCTGNITLRLHKKLNKEDHRALAVLMEYTYFCGSGHKTPQGLGQTRLIS